MYRSLLALDVKNPSVRQALANCQDMHRNLMKAFPEEQSSRREGQILYRQMTIEDRPMLFVLSRDLPDWDKVKGMKLLPDRPPLLLDGLEERWKAGLAFRFSLLTSPCKKVGVEGRKNSVRVYLRTPEEREIWICRKAEQNGFEILQLMQNEKAEIRGWKGNDSICYRTVAFEGVLRITDAVRFREAFANGIGPGKAYGLGLLMLARTY